MGRISVGKVEHMKEEGEEKGIKEKEMCAYCMLGAKRSVHLWYISKLSTMPNMFYTYNLYGWSLPQNCFYRFSR
jgi:hypothetical protein